MKTNKLTLDTLKVNSFNTSLASQAQGGLSNPGGQVSYVMPNTRPICFYTDGGYPCY